MNKLPNDMLWQIGLYLDLKDIKSFMLGYKDFYFITQNDNFWKELFNFRHPYGYSKSKFLNQNLSWKGKTIEFIKKIFEVGKNLDPRFNSDGLFWISVVNYNTSVFNNETYFCPFMELEITKIPKPLYREMLLISFKHSYEWLSQISYFPNDKELVLAAVKKSGTELFYASDQLKNDKEVVLAAVKQNGMALGLASDELKDDKEVVLVAVKKFGTCLFYASVQLKNNKDVVLTALKQDGETLEYASKELQKDKNVVLVAVKQYGKALKFASDELKNNKEVVLAAVKQCPDSFEYASDQLRNDKELCLIHFKEIQNRKVIKK